MENWGAQLSIADSIHGMSANLGVQRSDAEGKPRILFKNILAVLGASRLRRTEEQNLKEITHGGNA